VSDEKPTLNEIAKMYMEEAKDYRDLYTILRQFESECKKEAPHIRGQTSDKRYIKKDEHSAAYSYVLEHNGTPLEALEYASEVFNQDEDWVGDVKNSPTLFSRDVVKEHDNHPIQKKMARKKIFERTSLTSAKTPMQQLGRLSVFRTIFEELEDLRESNKEHTKRITKLEAQQVLHEEEIHRLHIKEPPLTTEEKVLLLKDAGCSDTMCAEVLGISERTVRRHKGVLRPVKYPTEKADKIS